MSIVAYCFITEKKMRIKNYIELLSGFTGFMIGVLIYTILFSSGDFKHSIQNSNFKNFIKDKIARQMSYLRDEQQRSQKIKYNTTLADKLYDEVKVLCLILTQPSNHKTKAFHVKNTWGKKCNRLVLLSSKPDPDTETFVFPRNETRDILWGKVRTGFENAFQKYYKDYDWFLKGDDDS